MTDERLAADLRSWLKDSDTGPADVGGSIARVEARLTRTRQRGRWWPLSILGRASVAPSAIPDLKEAVAYIEGRLEENERDMFVLMKMVKENLEKKKAQIADGDIS